MRIFPRVSALCTSVILAACSNGDSVVSENIKPNWLVGTPIEKSYDGMTDDLLTAGLGKTGLASGTSPTVSSPPTAAELRRLAIYNNYRALTDTVAGGGYGSFFGPNIDLKGNSTLGEGKIAGNEYLAFADSDGSGKENVSMLLQVPSSFDSNNPCIVAGPVSGSRGVYGAIGTTGEWALKHGCAVVYTDRGAGNGAHDLSSRKVTLIDGTLADVSTAGKNAQFVATLNDPNYISRKPGRFAFKHAHSQLNPERNWGRDTLRSIEFAFYTLNSKLAQGRLKFTPANTLVIATSVSNGGGSVLQAAEDDQLGLIDGVVAIEPQINVKPNLPIDVRKGGTTVSSFGKPLFDYITMAYLYQPCAALASSVSTAPGSPGNGIFGFFAVDATLGAARCSSLKDAGLVTGNTTADQSADALNRLHSLGWENESDFLHASHFAFSVPNAVAVTYANAFKQASVSDELCGFSLSSTDANGLPTVASSNPMYTIFSSGNGIPPTNGINLIAERSVGGAINEVLATSASTNRRDYNFDGAKCLRDLLTDLTVQSNIQAVSRDGQLRRKPTLIVHGRSDALVPVNHTSRAYLAANGLAEGANSKLSYIEVTNAQHFEAFLGYDTGLAQRYIPLTVYGTRALDLMWGYLKSGTPLPASQVVRTTPRGGSGNMANPLNDSNVPAIQITPSAANAITVNGGQVNIPN
jgi:hydroxybutyrate-dimer hydrolase